MTEAYSVRLEAFEGPLDLLLHLVRKHEVNLYEVSVAAVTEQYLAYLAAAKDLNLDVAGEYVLMAATLIYLKSRALLPPEEREDLEEEEPLDPELELIEQLLEYERYQAVASNLASRPVLGRDVFERRVVESVPGLFSEPFRPLTSGDLLAALDPRRNRPRDRDPARAAPLRLRGALPGRRLALADRRDLSGDP